MVGQEGVLFVVVLGYIIMRLSRVVIVGLLVVYIRKWRLNCAGFQNGFLGVFLGSYARYGRINLLVVVIANFEGAAI